MRHDEDFQLLREACSAALEQFIAQASKIELIRQRLQVPLSTATAQEFYDQCNMQDRACERYLTACLRFREFLERHRYSVH